MAGYKETPRQKMIAMMYLVLTALLALNVSKDILDAFLVVNESIESTNVGIEKKVDFIYNKFETQYQLNPDKVGPKWQEAQQVKAESDKLLKYLDDLKFYLVQKSEMGVVQKNSVEDSIKIRNLYFKDTIIGGKKQSFLMLDLVPTKDKYDNTTHYMIGNNGSGEAYRLSKKLKEYRNFMLQKMNEPQDSKKIGLIILPGKAYRDATGTKEDWEYHNFNHTILAADITLVNKIINEVRSAEFDVANYLYASITATDYKFDNVAAKIIPKSTYVLKNRKYEADILVAAYDSKTKPDVYYVTGVDKWKPEYKKRAKKVSGSEGSVKLEFPATTEGVKKYAGVIELLDPKTNKKVQYPFSGKYIVAPPSLTVSPLKMNVFYIGVKNPVSISVPGLSMNDVTPTISKGKLYKDPKNKGQWIVEVPKGIKKVTVSASAKIEGKNYALGSVEFRVKRVPDPTATIAGMTGGSINKNQLLAAGAIIPEMRGFEFDLYFQITSYSFTTLINGDFFTIKAKGNTFSKDIVKRIRSGKRKQKFFFENIQAKGPDGSKRSLNPVNLELK
jgi:gliding motility-associated protein GldM